jgi:hypothetical protein
MRRLGIEKDSRKKQAVCDWQAVVTKAVQLPVLIDAAGVLEMAKVGDWVGRSRVIGDLLREVVRERVRSMRGGGDEESEIEVIGGLDSFIFMHKKVAVTFLVMGALGAGSKVSWVRWLPRLDRQLMERSTVEALLGSGSLKKRKGDSELLVKKGVRPQWCFYCGTWARGTEYPWCKTCCVDSCDAVECIHQLLSHKCLG